jgi:hypothetical protein
VLALSGQIGLVRNALVNYAIRWSASVTTLTARHVRLASTSSASLVPSLRYKEALVPAAFQQLSPSPFLPFALHLPVPPPWCFRWQPSSTYSLPGPALVPQNRYDAASGKNVAARRLTLIRSTSRQHCLVDPPAMTPMKRPGVSASRRRLGHATALDAGPLLPALRTSSINSSHLPTSPPWSTKTALARRPAASSLRRPVADLHQGWF